VIARDKGEITDDRCTNTCWAQDVKMIKEGKKETIFHHIWQVVK
jgi:hypothetical protein